MLDFQHVLKHDFYETYTPHIPARRPAPYRV